MSELVLHVAHHGENRESLRAQHEQPPGRTPDVRNEYNTTHHNAKNRHCVNDCCGSTSLKTHLIFRRGRFPVERRDSFVSICVESFAAKNRPRGD